MTRKHNTAILTGCSPVNSNVEINSVRLDEASSLVVYELEVTLLAAAKLNTTHGSLTKNFIIILSKFEKVYASNIFQHIFILIYFKTCLHDHTHTDMKPSKNTFFF